MFGGQVDAIVVPSRARRRDAPQLFPGAGDQELHPSRRIGRSEPLPQLPRARATTHIRASRDLPETDGVTRFMSHPDRSARPTAQRNRVPALEPLEPRAMLALTGPHTIT